MTGAEMMAWRQRLELSRAKLAAELGVHWNTVNKWEREISKIPEPVARLLQKIVAERLPPEAAGPAPR